MTTGRRCPGCRIVPVGPAAFACPDCWQSLPPILRRKVTNVMRARRLTPDGEATVLRAVRRMREARRART